MSLIYSKKKPVLRLVTTNRCNLQCHYCPPDNEDFPSSVVGKGGPRSIDWEKLSVLLDISVKLGFDRFSLTGGEPLITKAPVDFLVNHSEKYLSLEWVLQTNGVYLNQYLDDLSRIRKLTLKISLDVFSQSAYRDMCGQDFFHDVLHAIREARNKDISVGINMVLTKDSLPFVPRIITFAREVDCYLKILDLNWYIDVGTRSAGMPVSDEYWIKQYVDPEKSLLPELSVQGIDNFTLKHQRGFGIPVLDSSHEGEFFVRVKDSKRGTTYAKPCMLCSHFITRKCQEGVYELTLTPDFRIKICRHRPDIEYNVDPSLHENWDIEKTFRKVLSDFYNSVKHFNIPKVINDARKKQILKKCK